MPASPWSAVVRANVALAPGSQKDAFSVPPNFFGSLMWREFY